MKSMMKKMTLWLCVVAMLLGVLASCVKTATPLPNDGGVTTEAPTEAPTQAPDDDNKTPDQGNQSNQGGNNNQQNTAAASAVMTFGENETGMAAESSESILYSTSAHCSSTSPASLS